MPTVSHLRILCSFLCIGLLLSACRDEPPATDLTTETTIQVVSGETMGTYYRVSYTGAELTNLQAELDAVLVALNLEVSTYIDSSTISRFNQGENPANSKHFDRNFEMAQAIYEQTQGLFDPTVMPLVNYWGFGYTPKRPVTAVDSFKVDSLVQLVGMDRVSRNTASGAVIYDRPAGLQLDFSALAKGYGVDLLCSYLRSKGRSSYFVDIGGEVRASGDKGEKGPWRVGIAVPREDASPSDVQVAVPVIDKAIATSGNYRNFYEVNGTKYSHTINPQTGFPERSTLLSASVLANDCATADAYATACMVAGLDRAYDLIDSTDGLEAYFIYSLEDGTLASRHTAGFGALLNEEQQ